MNSENFHKLFTEDYNKAKLASIFEPENFQSKTKEEKREIIEREQQTISPELGQAIHRFIQANKGRVHGNQLRSMVKKQFGITVV